MILNLVWVFLAAASVRLWLRHAPRSGAKRGTQAVAVVMYLAIILPVISVTDDLAAAQNLAIEVLPPRRDHAFASPHPITPAAALPTAAIAELCTGFQRFVSPCLPSAPVVDNLALASFRNRPPPAA